MQTAHLPENVLWRCEIFSVNIITERFFYNKIYFIGGPFIMEKQKKPVHRVQMTEGKRNIIHQLLEEYDIQTADDI